MLPTLSNVNKDTIEGRIYLFFNETEMRQTTNNNHTTRIIIYIKNSINQKLKNKVEIASNKNSKKIYQKNYFYCTGNKHGTISF